MKLRSLLLLPAFAAVSLQADAQPWVNDSVYTGGSYAKDVYYSFKNDSIKAEDNNNWHIAFEMIPQMQNGSVGVLANHVRGGVNVFSLPFRASTKFGALTAADTATKTPLINPDSTWHYGAFNINGVATNPLDYGWGKYSMTTHHVEGDSLYLVYVGANPYQFTIKHYHSHPIDSIYYEFRIAKFDGSEDTTIKVYRKYDGFENRNFAYYNATTRSFSNREPVDSTWDVVFTRYLEYISAGGPTLVPYPVPGVLSNVGVEVAEVDGVDPDTAKYDNPNYTYSDHIHTIGSNWKAFDNTTFQYSFDTNRTYFVKTDKTKEYYQVVFTGFGGSANGKYVFSKRKVADYPVSVNEVAKAVAATAIVPNPASNSADLMIDANQAIDNAQLFVTDMSGRVVYRTAVNVKAGMNGFRINTSDLATGLYLVNVTNGIENISNKLSVQH